ncbi:MAG: type II toxin-antitoxin system PemK/MazF family toxin [Thermoguttaceae bacterium]|jgi:mRNA interferase MazF
MPNPKRGEVWLVDLGMVAKVRPCLILSVLYGDNDRALVTVVPHSTKSRNSDFEVRLDLKFLRPGVFVTQNLTSIPVTKLLRKLGDMPQNDIRLVEDSVRAWLGL